MEVASSYSAAVLSCVWGSALFGTSTAGVDYQGSANSGIRDIQHGQFTRTQSNSTDIELITQCHITQYPVSTHSIGLSSSTCQAHQVVSIAPSCGEQELEALQARLATAPSCAPDRYTVTGQRFAASICYQSLVK